MEITAYRHRPCLEMPLNAKHEGFKVGAGSGLKHDLGCRAAICNQEVHCADHNTIDFMGADLRPFALMRQILQPRLCCSRARESAETLLLSAPDDSREAPGSAGESVLAARRTAASASTGCPEPSSAPATMLTVAPGEAKGVSQGLLLCRCRGSSCSGSARRACAGAQNHLDFS